MESLKDATNALEQEDFLLNKGLTNSLLIYNRCFSDLFQIQGSFLYVRN